MMPVFDVIMENIGALQFGLAFLEFDLLLKLIAGGWVNILRGITFFIDKKLVWIITKAYDYFELIVSKELFAPNLINQITKNVYFFIAVFVLFKLAVRLMKYIMEPDLVSDQNIGSNAIIKRTIVGMCLILFLPSLFGLIRDFQKAIIKDDIINNIIMDKNTQLEYEGLKERAPVGRIIGFGVLQGFLTYDEDAFGTSMVAKQWETAKTNFDPSGISINAGGIGYIDNYYYDYIPIISTVALGYVAWLLIKYCFDVLVRFFKLAVLQIISPIVVVDYIFDGGGQGSFKQWMTTVISTFAMLFIRILSLSLVIMVSIHMQMTQTECIDKYANSNSAYQEDRTEDDRIACENSLLYLDEDGKTDNLLRAAVMIALIAFSMDLPKLFSQIFGLDLEQESSVTGMVQKIGGVGKMVGLGGLAIGGGLLGGAIGNVKAATGGVSKIKGLNSAENNLDNKAKDLSDRLAGGNISQDDYNAQMKDIDSQRETIHNQKKAVLSNTSKQMSASSNKAFGAILAATPVGRATSSFSDAYGAQKAEQDKQEQKEKMAQEQADEAAYRQHQMETSVKQLKATNAIRYKLGVDPVFDIEKEEDPNAASFAQGLKDSGFKGINEKLDNISTTSQITAEHTVNIDNKMNTVVKQTEHISNQVDKIEDNTFYSGVDSINNMENSGYIDKPIKNLSDNAPKSAEPTKKNSNDDIEML